MSPRVEFYACAYKRHHKRPTWCITINRCQQHCSNDFPVESRARAHNWPIDAHSKVLNVNVNRSNGSKYSLRACCAATWLLAVVRIRSLPLCKSRRSGIPWIQLQLLEDPLEALYSSTSEQSTIAGASLRGRGWIGKRRGEPRQPRRSVAHLNAVTTDTSCWHCGPQHSSMALRSSAFKYGIAVLSIRVWHCGPQHSGVAFGSSVFWNT